ncbi:MAG TPA: SDR family NAD(P)-dependent oxidoreductase [Gemmatimonadales bacterium]|nr:SDR family NAD(P)-dependent oxidoreductase [Gemmatimonadales bacterium]
MIDLTGLRAFVTGGSRGIGRATAVLLARAGAGVAIGYATRREDADATVAAIRAAGGDAEAVAGDLGDPAAAERVVAEVAQRGLDLLVVNHGIWPPTPQAVAAMTAEQWERTCRANLDSVFFVTRAAIPHLPEGGRIVLVASTAGQRGEAFHADYAATKGAVISFTKSLAVELAPRITVNCVAPGWVDTEMSAVPYAADGGAGRRAIERTIPMGRVATPEEIAGPIVFLCSDLARFLTGEILNVNGGSVLCG